MSEPKLRLGEQLLAAGLITDEGLREALAEQKVEGGYLADRLVELGLVDERNLLRFLAELTGAKYITVDTLAKAQLPPEALEKVPARHAELLCVLPLAFDARDSVLTLAVPELEQGLFEQVRLAAAVAKVQPIVALRASIRAGIRRFYYADHYAFATLDHGTAKPVVRPAVRESIIARSSAPKPMPQPKAAEDTERLRNELNRWKAVAELSRVLARERNVKALLHRALAFAFDQIPADDGVALLWDPKAKQLVPRGVRVRSGEVAEVPVSETLLKEIISEGGAITTDATVDERFSSSESIMASALRSALGVALKVSDQLSGALVFGTRGENAAVFKPEDLALAEELAKELALAIERIQTFRREETENLQRDRYSKHFPPATADQINQGALKLPEGGERYRATVLSARVIGSSAELGDDATPSSMVGTLSLHAEQMSDVVFAHGGMVLDNPGAHTVALFGVPRERGDELDRAVITARELLERVQFANELRIAEGRPSLEISIGIARGDVIVGVVGERMRSQFTALGHALSRAQQLVSSAHAGELVLDDEVAQAIEGRAGALEPGPISGSQRVRR
ncbi:MAG: GAF domain-containing protein [Deltaproteobacteria bacterium]|nr:GAF domain-containing protein [Deltaproteobacteria bacterium]